MLLSAVSILVVAQSSSEIPEGLMNNPVYRAARHTPLFAKSPDCSWSWIYWVCAFLGGKAGRK